MARLEARKKMGFYPTPEETLLMICRKLHLTKGATLLDPCCGDGSALFSATNGYTEVCTYGVELDTERTSIACQRLTNVISGSIYDTLIRPLECFSR